MGEFIPIFEIGDMEYPEKLLNKPVRYDGIFLKDIASKTGTITITENHTNNVIGELSNFIYEDGFLKAEKPTNMDLKGLGLSPVFDVEELKDCGDYYAPVKGVLSEIGLTKTPKNQILYNSIIKEDAGKNMSEALDIIIKEKEELQKRIGVLENEKETYKNLLKQKDDEFDKIKESYSDVESKLEELDKLKEQESKFLKMEEDYKNDLLNDICGDNEQMREDFKDFTKSQLILIQKNQSNNREGTGIPPNLADGLDGNGENPTDNNDDDTYSEEDFLKDYEAAGWE